MCNEGTAPTVDSTRCAPPTTNHFRFVLAVPFTHLVDACGLMAHFLPFLAWEHLAYPWTPTVYASIPP